MTPRYHQVAQFYARGLEDSGFDFSEQAMLEMFEAETYGTKHDLRHNGYSFGKKAMDITLAAWREDLLLGNITKYELWSEYEEYSFEREFVQELIKHWPVSPFFGYLKP